MAHVNEPVPSILEVKQDLPYGCEAIIKKAMSKEPAERYDKATDLAREFQQALESSPPPSKVNLKALLWKIGGAIVIAYLAAWLGVVIEGTTGGIGAYAGLVFGLIVWFLVVSQIKK